MVNGVEEPPVDEIPPAASVPREPDRASLRVWRALLWCEWFAHSQTLLIFLGVWLVAVWTLPLFTHSAWILLLGVVYALIAGPLYGGGDTLEGCEEFTFALPVTRGERFLARLVVGGGTVLGLGLMNVVALGIDLPQVLAGIYVRTGLSRSAPMLKPGLLYAIVLALPFCIFSIAFALSAATHSRMFILASWLWAGLGALSLLQIGFWYEQLVMEQINGVAGCASLGAASVGALWRGYAVFRKKEIGKPSMPVTLPGLWWLWSLLLVLGAGLAIALVNSLAKHFPAMMHP